MAYSLYSYGRMIQDNTRIDAYNEALKRAMQKKPNATVLELGTGTGIVAYVAKNLGAKRVIAVEPNDNIEIAIEQKKENNTGDEVEFLRAFSTDISLDEKADILISDMRGVLPMLGGHLAAIIDARDRLLSPEGIQISECDTLYCALASDEQLYDETVEHWNQKPCGVSMLSARHKAANSWYSRKVKAQDLRSEKAEWASIDYLSITSPNVKGACVLRANKPSTVHGLSLWFDTRVYEDIALTNAPWEPELAYGHCFFPFERALNLKENEEVHIDIDARLVAGSYLWRWNTKVPSQNIAFKQSTFYATPLNKSVLNEHKGEDTFSLNSEGEVALFVLERAQENVQTKDIARECFERFSARYENQTQALSEVLRLARTYSKGAL